MRSWRWYSKLLFALLVAAFAYWVWPTPWQYFILDRPGVFGNAGPMLYGTDMSPVAGAPGGTFIVRVHRVTGRAYTLSVKGGGWQRYRPQS
jgi:hypothetical protein